MTDYEKFIENKTHLGGMHGFDPIWMPDDNFDFQTEISTWNIRKGRSATFADCGMGKSRMLLTFAENVVRHTNKPVLVITPIAVGFQMIQEAEKIGVNAERCTDGKFSSKIVVTNYERLHYFDRNDFIGCVCDESSILKNFDGVTKLQVTEFMKKMPYRLLCTATAAPNDYIELGTSSEALGELGYIDMLKMFFKANNDSYAQGGSGNGARRWSHDFGGKFRFRGHAERDFWRWVCSWARALRKPSDMGFDDGNFILPELITNQHIVKARSLKDGYLLPLPARGLQEQREERSRTVDERCEHAAMIACSTKDPVVSWCHLNREGDLIEKLIPDAKQISGSDSDERKEELFKAFQSKQLRVLVTKPQVAGFGFNWQHCNHQTFFPSHSFEQWYQCIRRSWRFGQKNPVTIDVIATEGESDVLQNLKRKEIAAMEMFDNLVSLMNNELKLQKNNKQKSKGNLPTWM